jgi:hypothetical protein
MHRRSLIAFLWLAGITVRYLDTVHNAITHPFNTGADSEWALILVALVAAQITSIVVCGPRAVKVWFSVGLVVALTMVLMSGEARAVLCAVLLLVNAVFWGEWILTRFDKHIVTPLSAAETAVMSLSLGLTFLAFAGLGLALIGFLNSTGVWVLMGVLLIPHLRKPRIPFWKLLELSGSTRWDRQAGILRVIIGFVFLLNLTWALVPEIQFDANNYHLAVTRAYLEHGQIVDMPNFFHSYFVHMMEIPIALGLALGGPITAKFLIFCTGLLATVATYSLGTMLFGQVVGLWSAALFCTTALVSWLSGTVYVDGPLILFVTASVLAFLHWQKAQNRAWLVITALLVGASAGIKLQAVYVIPGMVAAELWLHRHDLSWSKARLYVVVVLIAMVVAAPWYGIVYGFTANPVFPLYNGLFKSPLWPFENTLTNAQEFGMGITASSLARVPFRMTFDTGRFGEGLPRGALGVGILLFLPLGILFARRERLTLALLIIASSSLLLWAFTFQYARYYVSFLPLILCLGVDAFYRRAYLFQTCVMILVAAQIVASPPKFWNIPERFPVFTALGLETPASFLTRSLPGYESSTFLNSVVQPGDRILGVETENVRYYLDGPLDSLAEATAPSPLHFISQRQPDEGLARALALNGYKYLFVSVHSVQEAAPTYPFLNPDFLRKYAELIYLDVGTRVFRMRLSKDKPIAREEIHNGTGTDRYEIGEEIVHVQLRNEDPHQEQIPAN